MEGKVLAQRQAGIDYLRAFVTLLVLAHHSSLAYVTFGKADPTNPLLSTAPIVDSQRLGFLDYAENFNDVFFMSLMFFLSGLFVWRSLQAKGVPAFLRDRLIRLGIPFAIGVLTVIPFAYFPAWLAAGKASDPIQFWLGFLGGGYWSPGPLWFLWVLLAFDLVAALLFLIFGKLNFRYAGHSPLLAFAALFVVCFFAYAPMLANFGFGTWVPFLSAPFWFQLPRIFLYLTWFLAGALLGINGPRQGFLREGSPFAKGWPLWIAVAVLAYNALWFVPNLVAGLIASELLRGAVYVALWILSCCASCFGLVSLFLGTMTTRRPWMDSLSRCAYLMYWVHYAFVLWSQYALLSLPIGAAFKFLITLTLTVFGSWGIAALLLRIRAVRNIA